MKRGNGCPAVPDVFSKMRSSKALTTTLLLLMHRRLCFQTSLRTCTSSAGLKAVWITPLEAPSRQASGCSTLSAVSVTSREDEALSERSSSLGDETPDFELKLAKLQAADAEKLPLPCKGSGPCTKYPFAPSRAFPLAGIDVRAEIGACGSGDFLGKVRCQQTQLLERPSWLPCIVRVPTCSGSSRLRDQVEYLPARTNFQEFACLLFGEINS